MDNTPQYLDDINSSAKSVLKGYEQSTIERSSFLTWLVGIGSAGFFLAISKWPSAHCPVIGLPSLSNNALLSSVVMFLLLLAFVLLYRVTLSKIIMGVTLGHFALDYQRTVIVNDPSAYLASLAKGDMPNTIKTYMYMGFLSQEGMRIYLKGRMPYKKAENRAAIFYWVSIAVFAVDILSLSVAFVLPHVK